MLVRKEKPQLAREQIRPDNDNEENDNEDNDNDNDNDNENKDNDNEENDNEDKDNDNDNDNEDSDNDNDNEDKDDNKDKDNEDNKVSSSNSHSCSLGHCFIAITNTPTLYCVLKSVGHVVAETSDICMRLTRIHAQLKQKKTICLCGSSACIAMRIKKTSAWPTLAETNQAFLCPKGSFTILAKMAEVCCMVHNIKNSICPPFTTPSMKSCMPVIICTMFEIIL